DAFLGMLWDGAGEAQIDLQPESAFLTELNGRPFPKDIYWVGIAGTGSPVDLLNIQNNSRLSQTSLGQSVGKLQKTFPELFKGTGDGVVSTDSLHCAEMNAVYYVEANHRNMVRDPSGTPPAIEIIKDVLSRK
ncbi:MAG: hypothetical protein O7C75_16380, partial [Verrucomicrobia bacterium]|nr:hypothetical protein [Verrucomicrobiota bacterium]